MDSQIKLCSLGISCYCNVIVIHMGVLGEHPKIWWLIITFPVRKTNWNDKLPTVSQQLQNSNVDALDRPCPPASRFTLRRLNMTGWCFHSFTQCVLLCFTLFYYGLPCFACGHDWLWYIMVNYQWLELWLWFMVALVVVMAWNEKKNAASPWSNQGVYGCLLTPTRNVLGWPSLFWWETFQPCFGHLKRPRRWYYLM